MSIHRVSALLAMSTVLGVSHVLYAAPKNAGAGKAPEPVPQPQPAAPLTPTAAAFAFAIEDNIPLPTKKIGVKGESAYPFAVINVGQSFFVPASDKIKEPWKTLTSMASRMSRELHPKQFTTGRVTVNGVEGVRIWRKADTDQPLQPPRKKTPKSPDPQPEAQTGAADPFAGGTQTQQPAAA